MFMKKIGDLTSASFSIKPMSKEEQWEDEKNLPIAFKNEVFVKQLEGPLFFGATSSFTASAQQIPIHASTLIIRLEKVLVSTNRAYMPWKM